MTIRGNLLKKLLLTGMAVMLFFTGCGQNGGNSEKVHIQAEIVETDASGAAAGMEKRVNLAYDLSVPTQITKIGGLYFIVDCYHNQIIYSESLDTPINQWLVMTSEINKGHTVAGDGKVYLTDDTENNRILVFEYEQGVFVNTQVFNDIGVRPHYIVYNEEDASFYAWSSMTGQMYVFGRDEGTGEMYISRIMTIPELEGVYVRSFTIEGEYIYLVSGNSQIIKAGREDFKIAKRYNVPDSMAGMIQIMPVKKGYYITVSTDASGNQDFATIIYTQELSDLAEGKYTDIYSSFIGGGTPYYMGNIEGRYFLTEHRLPGHSIWAFDVDEKGMPVNVETVY